MENVTTQPKLSDWETSQSQISQPAPAIQAVPEVIERKRNLGGRPKKLLEEKAVVKFYPSYTLSQWQKLQERAAAVGLTEVELIRKLSLDLPLGRTLPAPSREALALLSNAATNLNQIAKKLNANYETDNADIMFVIADTRAAIEKMGASLHDQ